MSERRPVAPEPAEIAGRYQVTQRLGAGAFGTVYKARDTTLGREVAIKTIRLEGLAAASTDLDELLKRFKQEATAGAALKHPNIVTVYDFGQSAGLTYLAMEYVEGVGLDRIIAETGKLPIDRAAGLAAQVADALGYAHEKKVIHRDIKPANIMVEAAERVKVTDFGIARVTDSAEQLTATGGLLGTPSYMSPEQAKGMKVDGRSDLFSVGCVLYELLAGRKAFTGDNITGILFKIITEDPPSIQELDPLLPAEMVRVVQKALAKDPDARYQTGQELASDLLALTRPGYVPTVRQTDVPTRSAPPGDVPTLATPATAPGSISSIPTAARPLAPAARTSAPTSPTEFTGGAGTAAPPPIPPAEATRRPTPAPARRSARPAGKGGRVVGVAAVAAVLLLAVGAIGAWMLVGRSRSGAPAPGADQVATPSPPRGAVAPEARIQPTPRAEAPTAAPAPSTAATTPRAAGSSASGPAEALTASPQAASTRSDSPPRQTSAAPPRTVAAAPPRPDDAFLDELPEPDGSDGRAAGQALAQAYGAGDAPAYGSSARFRRRPRIPRDTRPAEQPAVRTLAWILSAQNAHSRRTGRYGTLSELIDADDLPLTVPHTGDGFDRREYRFTVTAGGGGFRADAKPLSPGGRAFYVDDNGFVLPADE